VNDQVQADHAAVESISLKDAAKGLHSAVQPHRWPSGLRIGFRFCFVYLSLFSLSTPIAALLFSLPNHVRPPMLGVRWPLRQITIWVGTHVLRRPVINVQLVAGGDIWFGWVLVFSLQVLALMITAVWSALDQRRQNYRALHNWFRLFVRFGLASEMLIYGLVKVIPMQMPFPALTTLVEPFGNFTPVNVLWASVGSSPGYEIFAGSAEVLAGILLIFPRTAMLGALVCLADMIHVFTLNMTYDIPVKVFSFHLLLMSLFLLAPEMPRLISFFFSNRAVGPSTQAPLFRSQSANRAALILQILFGFYLAGMHTYQNIQRWHLFGGGQPKPSLYGIWNAEKVLIDGQVRPPLITDYDRWRRVIIDSSTSTSFQRMDDSFDLYSSKIDDKGKTITLMKESDNAWKAGFIFDRPTQNSLILDGAMDGHKVHMELTLFDVNRLKLINSRFHWVYVEK
jgi:uncharacterized membrane protein YphA (DoxX/SURF4 family)